MHRSLVIFVLIFATQANLSGALLSSALSILQPLVGATVNLALQVTQSVLNLLGADYDTLFVILALLIPEPLRQSWEEELRLDEDDEKSLLCDFIIVGVGTAGSVIANRLSENKNWIICCFEAGKTETWIMRVPVAVAYWAQTNINWNYVSEQQEGMFGAMEGGRVKLHQGKVVGGTTLMNYMINSRGHPNDYDRLKRELGIPGWSYDDCLPYFKKVERVIIPALQNSPYRGYEGKINTEKPRWETKLADAFNDGVMCAGYNLSDWNSNETIGGNYVQATTDTGARVSAARGYIYTIANDRTNLKFRLRAHVTKVLIHPENNTAYGIEYIDLRDNKLYKSYAKREVILSAGALSTPKILMHSGIGPEEHLTNFNIPVIQNLPVGEKLHDNAAYLGLTFKTNTTGQSIHLANLIIDLTRFTHILPVTEYLLNGSGPWSSIGSVTNLGFISTLKTKAQFRDGPFCASKCNLETNHEPGDIPEIEYIYAAGSLGADLGSGFNKELGLLEELYHKFFDSLEPPNVDAFMILITLLNQTSSGKVRLRDTNPLSPPLIHLNYLESSEDVEKLLLGVREAECWINTEPFKKINATQLCFEYPNCMAYPCGSDDYWRCAFKEFLVSLWHFTATCRMGRDSSDKDAVVTPDLKVIGVDGLRVCDVGVLPFAVTSHTQIPAYMIGEKASDIIKAFYQRAKPRHKKIN